MSTAFGFKLVQLVLSLSVTTPAGTKVRYNLKPLKVLHLSCWLLISISGILDFAKKV